ncbi:MAG TPA: FAD-binding protein, partial [Desulforhopalus sp.]|nr:FAD-binding protein [Desulforhopalus sp.]
KLGLPQAALENTVTRFNAATRLGSFDPSNLDNCVTSGLQPAKSHWARPLDSPPYYGYPLRPGIGFTYMGVAVNERAQVLRQNSRPFENIFAAGEIAAGNILGKGYLAGLRLTLATVFGRIAGEEAARLGTE